MNETTTKTLRGTVIKTPSETPGLIIADGKQYPFNLERVWRSPVAPGVHQAVEMDFDGGGNLVSIQVLASLSKAQEPFGDIASLTLEQGRSAIDKAMAGVAVLKQRMGLYPLIAACVLVLAWFVLTSVSGISYDTSGLSFWDVSGLDMHDIAKLRLKERGALNLLGLMCLTGPFAAAFARKRIAHLAGALPFAFVVFTVIRLFVNVRNYFATQRVAAVFGQTFSQHPLDYAGMEQTAMRGAMKGVVEAASLGSGFYLIVAISAWLAWRSWRTFSASPQENP